MLYWTQFLKQHLQLENEEEIKNKLREVNESSFSTVSVLFKFFRTSSKYTCAMWDARATHTVCIL